MIFGTRSLLSLAAMNIARSLNGRPSCGISELRVGAKLGPMPEAETSRSSFSYQARELRTACIVSVLKLVSSFSSAE
jgi:hypothetical protein